MRQVPYAILGAGRAAQHFCHYFTLLGIPYCQWSRQQNKSDLTKIIAQSERILILINDDVIEAFILENPRLRNKTLLHCSGRLISPLAFGAHPLTSFSKELYDLETYQKIPFILDQYCPAFAELFPGLSNPSYRISSELKNFYHSLCVLSGNFTCMLWQKFFTELENKFKLPKAVAFPYMRQIFTNLQQDTIALTGPLVRGDQHTIAANLAALQDDPFQQVYQTFLEIFKKNQVGLYK